MASQDTTEGAGSGTKEIEEVLQELTAIRADIVAGPARSQSRLNAVHANCSDKAQNLLHYLALRRRDLRPVQLRLAALGLLSRGVPNPSSGLC